MRSLKGGRHERRVLKMDVKFAPATLRLHTVDPEIATAIDHERKRQQENIELIASENFTSPAVMEAQGSVLTNKYAEGYPKKRWYGGCAENVRRGGTTGDRLREEIVRRGTCQCAAAFRLRREHGGVFRLSRLPATKMLTMDLSHGGHTSTRQQGQFQRTSFSRSSITACARKTSAVDYDQLAAMARRASRRR